MARQVPVNHLKRVRAPGAANDILNTPEHQVLLNQNESEKKDNTQLGALRKHSMPYHFGLLFGVCYACFNPHILYA